MEIEDIYNDIELIRVEDKLLRIFSHLRPMGKQYVIYTLNEKGKLLVDNLLSKRKEILNSRFIMDSKYKLHIHGLNEALKAELLKMRRKMMGLYFREVNLHTNEKVRVEARCYIKKDYPAFHPIKTARAKFLWAILNGTYGCYDSKYEDGVMGFVYKFYNQKEASESNLLYMNRKSCNWNDGLDKNLTKDMHLTYGMYNLYYHCKFSIFDLLWIRDFNSEVKVIINDINK